ncbi:hypothetical protein OC835_004389 [Tilletia horrida]|nr:hypothetical protein OC835_004389 [Tilletia horrida]
MLHQQGTPSPRFDAVGRAYWPAEDDQALARLAQDSFAASNVQDALACTPQLDSNYGALSEEAFQLFNEVAVLSKHHSITWDALEAIRSMIGTSYSYRRGDEHLRWTAHRSLFDKVCRKGLQLWRDFLVQEAHAGAPNQIGTPTCICLHLVSSALIALNEALVRPQDDPHEGATGGPTSLIKQLLATLHIIDHAAKELEALRAQDPSWLLSSTMMREQLLQHCLSAQDSMAKLDVKIVPNIFELANLLSLAQGMATGAQNIEGTADGPEQERERSTGAGEGIYSTLIFDGLEDVADRNERIKQSIRSIDHFPLYSTDDFSLPELERYLQTAFLTFSQIGMPESAKCKLYGEVCFVGHLLVHILKGALQNNPASSKRRLQLCHTLGALSYLLHRAGKSIEAVLSAKEAISFLQPVFDPSQHRHVLLLARLELQRESALLDSPSFHSMDFGHSLGASDLRSAPLFRHALAARPNIEAKHGLSSALRLQVEKSRMDLQDEDAVRNEYHHSLDQLVEAEPRLFTVPRCEEAWNTCQQIKVQQMELGATSDDLVNALIVQGMAEFAMGEPDAAHQTLLDASEKVSWEDVESTAGVQVQYTLCAVLCALGRWAEARAEGQAALDRLEACVRSTYQPMYLDKARAHLFYAAALLAAKAFEDSKTHLGRALDACEAIRRRDAPTPEEKTAYDLLARLQEETGRKREAEMTKLKAATIPFAGYSEQLCGPPPLAQRYCWVRLDWP